MKKASIITILFLTAVSIILFIVFWNTSAATTGTEDTTISDSTHVSSPETEVYIPEEPETAPMQTTTAEESTDSQTEETPDSNPVSTITMEDALFIGDSRTVGLMEYAQIGGASFFASVGMNVYNIHSKPVSVPSIGKITLEDLLQSKRYGKIYIMLGINELGYNMSRTVEKYNDLITYIREKQPGAFIFIQANLCVTKSRSDTDKIINNTAIGKLNTALAALADGETIFYLDANTIFNDGNGNLPFEKCIDSAHLYGKYYLEWGQWIMEQTAAHIREG